MQGRIEKLRSMHGMPSERSQGKIVDYLKDDVIEFIKQSPFAVIASADSAGNCDASPRGGLAGFVKVLDSKRLFIPDIKGNRLFQSFGNFESNPKAGMIFFIPGNNKMVRVNGRVSPIEKEHMASLWDTLEVVQEDENSTLIQGFILEVDEAYSHCPRALQFSDLWRVN
jgi:predicted pyridoxine 5'-phosphate oxidase superfamily flavin-nucleotide-binding protein